jgi:LysR family transcriptional regulator, carnitine catabolism transcriptional activator
MVISLTLRQLEAFVAVAENGSYTKAARVLRMSQPGLTANILRLEDHLGVRLFDRTTRSVELTSAGADLLHPIRRLLEDLSQTISDMQGLSDRRRGRVVFACLPSIAARLVGPALQNFLMSFPGITVKIIDGDATNVASRVRTREADFGITSTPDIDDEIEFTPLLRDRCCVVCSADHALASAREVRLKDLAAYPFLTLGRTTGARRILDQVTAKADVHLNVICEIGQLSTLCGMIETGVGVSILPEASLPTIGRGGITARKLVDPVVERDLGLLTIRGRRLSPAADAFRALLLNQLPKVWRHFTVQRYPASQMADATSVRRLQRRGAAPSR